MLRHVFHFHRSDPSLPRRGGACQRQRKSCDTGRDFPADRGIDHRCLRNECSGVERQPIGGAGWQSGHRTGQCGWLEHFQHRRDPWNRRTHPTSPDSPRRDPARHPCDDRGIGHCLRPDPLRRGSTACGHRTDSRAGALSDRGNPFGKKCP